MDRLPERDSLPGGGTRVFDIPLAAGEHGVLTVIGTTTNFNRRVMDAGFDDLRHLHDVLRDVRILGLGEATHGTREFFQAKHRLIEFLVSELGFTVVAFEMDAGAAEVLDEYIRGGPGELREVVASQGMWQFNSEEVVELVAWLRDWNARLPEERRVRLVGFDFQVNERGRLELLRYLERVAPERMARTDSLLRQLVRQPRAEGPPAVAYYTLGDARRDSVAADASAGAHVIAWAHNGHVRADPYTMGFFLSERLGGAYYAVGLGFERGGFRALELTASRPPAMKDTFVGPAYQQSMGWLLRRAGGGNGFLDLRAAPRAGPAAEWLAQPRDMRSVGNGYIVWNPSGYLAIAIAPLQSFDGILFIEQTTPAVANTVSHLR